MNVRIAIAAAVGLAVSNVALAGEAFTFRPIDGFTGSVTNASGSVDALYDFDGNITPFATGIVQVTDPLVTGLNDATFNIDGVYGVLEGPVVTLVEPVNLNNNTLDLTNVLDTVAAVPGTVSAVLNETAGVLECVADSSGCASLVSANVAGVSANVPQLALEPFIDNNYGIDLALFSFDSAVSITEFNVLSLQTAADLNDIVFYAYTGAGPSPVTADATSTLNTADLLANGFEAVTFTATEVNQFVDVDLNTELGLAVNGTSVNAAVDATVDLLYDVKFSVDNPLTSNLFLIGAATQLSSNTVDPNQFLITSVLGERVVISEPATLAIVGIGMVGLGMRQRKRRTA